MTSLSFEKNPEMRSPAPRSSAEDRADCFVEQNDITPKASGTEDYAVIYIGRRYGLPPILARVIAELASYGGRFG